MKIIITESQLKLIKEAVGVPEGIIKAGGRKAQAHWLAQALRKKEGEEGVPAQGAEPIGAQFVGGIHIRQNRFGEGALPGIQPPERGGELAM